MPRTWSTADAIALLSQLEVDPDVIDFATEGSFTTLALFLTFFSMAPVAQAIQHDALDPYLHCQLSTAAAVERGFQPLKMFMVRQTHASDLKAVLAMAKTKPPSGGREAPRPTHFRPVRHPA